MGTSAGRAFWFLALLLGLFLAAASAPSPLYPLYQAQWQFSSSTLTAIYAVYAFGALGALLISGRLSDHVGRRRVVAIGLAIQISAMAAFLFATSVEWLLVARVLQGVGTGMATGALSAWLIDLQPPDRPGYAGHIGAIALVAGLGAGAVSSGLLIELAPYPLQLVFILLIVAFVLPMVALPSLPDVVARALGWRRSLRPQVGVPLPARRQFATTGPSMVALWSVAGLYLSLGPSLAITLIGSANRLAGGLVIAALLVTAAASSMLAARVEASRAILGGTLLLIVGVGLTLLAVALGTLAGLLLASAVTGLGFGPAFSAILRTLAPLAPADRRAALLAAIYIEVYLAFSLPAIAAGYGAGLIGLVPTAYWYGIAAMALAGVTVIAMLRGRSAAPN